MEMQLGANAQEILGVTDKKQAADKAMSEASKPVGEYITSRDNTQIRGKLYKTWDEKKFMKFIKGKIFYAPLAKHSEYNQSDPSLVGQFLIGTDRKSILIKFKKPVEEPPQGFELVVRKKTGEGLVYLGADASIDDPMDTYDAQIRLGADAATIPDDNSNGMILTHAIIFALGFFIAVLVVKKRS